MKLALTPRALLLAASLCLSRADILVQDGFLDETTVTNVMQQLPASGASRFRDVVDLPSTLYGRLLSVLQPGAEGRNLQAPVRGEQGPVAAHKDHFADGSVAAAQVGLVYLEGDGRMTFTHDATGKETVVDVKPGRFLSWNNAEYTHVLEAGLAPRRMLGPMAFKDGLLQSIGQDALDRLDGGPIGPEVLAQAYVTPLVVAAGRVFKVTLDVVVLDFTPEPTPDGRRYTRKLADTITPPLDELVVSCALGDFGPETAFPFDSKNKTDKFADEEELTFKHSTLRPNTWKPKLRYEEEGNELTWTLPEEGLVLEKQYKITWKVRVGRNVESGTELPLTVSLAGNVWSETVFVTVK